MSHWGPDCSKYALLCSLLASVATCNRRPKVGKKEDLKRKGSCCNCTRRTHRTVNRTQAEWSRHLFNLLLGETDGEKLSFNTLHWCPIVSWQKWTHKSIDVGKLRQLPSAQKLLIHVDCQMIGCWGDTQEKDHGLGLGIRWHKNTRHKTSKGGRKAGKLQVYGTGLTRQWSGWH